MTEFDWQTASDPLPMVRFLAGRAPPARLRLFAAACCRRAWGLLTDPRSRRAVEAAERFALKLEDDQELAAARSAAEAAYADLKVVARIEGANALARLAAASAAILSAGPDAEFEGDAPGAAVPADYCADAAANRAAEQATQCQLLRCVAGSPFREAALDPFAFSETAVAVARQIDYEGDFSALPILADALMDGGCDDAEVLGHCRAGGPHARGCWVVGWVLGRR